MLAEKSWGDGVVIFGCGLEVAQQDNYFLGSNLFWYLAPCLHSDFDIGIVEIIGPGSKCNLSDSELVTVAIRNFGDMDQYDFQISYGVNGILSATQIYTDTLKAGHEGIFLLQHQPIWT